MFNLGAQSVRKNSNIPLRVSPKVKQKQVTVTDRRVNKGVGSGGRERERENSIKEGERKSGSRVASVDQAEAAWHAS